MRATNRGEGRLKAIIWILFLAAVVYSAVKIIPVYVNNYELSDYIQNQNPIWLTQRNSSDEIRNAILAKAQDLSLPVRAEQVSVDAPLGHVTVSVDYSVPINLLVYTWDLPFHISAENNRL
jgi:hypothetical protein